MWQRTKRLINSYLDNLVERLNKPDSDAREITRAEIARLGELEVQAQASAKMIEKELAEVELKIAGISERERILRERGDLNGAAAATSDLQALAAQADLLRRQSAEAAAAASRAKKLREERRVAGEHLASETYLTQMRENLAGLHSPFDASDPAATLDEMRARLRPGGVQSAEDRVAEADRQMEALSKGSQVEDLLARYKRDTAQAHQPAPPTPRSAPTPDGLADEETAQEKTLGRAGDGVKPID